jgi:CBS domain-containing protein
VRVSWTKEWTSELVVLPDDATLGRCRAARVAAGSRHVVLTQGERAVAVLETLALEGPESDDTLASSLAGPLSSVSMDEEPGVGLARLAARADDHVLIVDGAGRPRGLFTEIDALERAARTLSPRWVVEDVASTSLHTGRVDGTAGDAKERMRRAWIRHLIICDGGLLAGVLSWRDVATAPPEAPVAGLFCSETVTVGWRTPLADAAARMLEHQVGCLPVVDAKQPRLVQAVVTRTDLIRALGSMLGPGVGTA